LLFIIFFYALTARGQSCDHYASLTTDQHGERMYAFTNYIDVYDGPKKFSLYGFIWETSVVLVIDVVTEFRCLDTNADIIFQFADGSKLEMQNQVMNCERQVVIHLNKKTSLAQLEALRTKEIKRLSIFSSKLVRTEADLKKEVSRTTRLSIDCLADFLSDTPLRDTTPYDSLIAQNRYDSTSTYKIVVEHMPEFFGGYEGVMDYIIKNIDQPKSTKGEVKVSFVVNKEGAIENAHILQGISPAVDSAVLRAVRSMTRWKPGLQNGKPVNVLQIIPIRFK
jgi:TonB family protein